MVFVRDDAALAREAAYRVVDCCPTSGAGRSGAVSRQGGEREWLRARLPN